MPLHPTGALCEACLNVYLRVACLMAQARASSPPLRTSSTWRSARECSNISISAVPHYCTPLRVVKALSRLPHVAIHALPCGAGSRGMTRTRAPCFSTSKNWARRAYVCRAHSMASQRVPHIRTITTEKVATH